MVSHTGKREQAVPWVPGIRRRSSCPEAADKSRAQRHPGKVWSICWTKRFPPPIVPPITLLYIFENKLFIMGNKTIIAFDVYGTLLSTESIAKELATHFGKEKGENLAALWRRIQLEYTWRLNSMRRFFFFFFGCNFDNGPDPA